MPNARGFLDADIRRVLRHYWRAAGMRPLHIVAPLVLTFLEAAFEGASFSLLVPLTQALSHNSFGFLGSSKAFGWITRLVPASMASSPKADAYLALAILLLALVLRVGKMAAQAGRNFYLDWRDELFYARVQEGTFARILGFGRQYFDRKTLGHIDTELSFSRAVVDFLNVFDSLLSDVLSIIAKVTVMVMLSVPLTITIAVVFPAIVVILGRISRAVEREAEAGVALEIHTKSRALELLASTPLLKALSQERKAAAAYATYLDEARRVSTRRRNLKSLRWPVEESLVLVTVVVAQGIIMLTARSFVPGDLARLAAFIVLVQQIMPNLKCFGAFGMGLAELRPRFYALAKLLSDQDKYVVTAGDRIFQGLGHGIEVRDLSFSYAEAKPALKGVSASIPAHALTAIVGASGSGKTTFCDLLARFYECPPGTIFLDGTDIREFSLSSLYQRMAIVSQEVWLLNRTLRENLVYGLDDPPSDDALLELLADVKLEGLGREHDQVLDLLLGDRGVQLSGGQRQRVALARALLRNPDILILDEATSALDSVAERTVTEAITRRLGGRTMLVIAHRLSTVRGAEHVLVFRDGRITETGSWDELLGRGGEFTTLYRAQFQEVMA